MEPLSVFVFAMSLFFILPESANTAKILLIPIAAGSHYLNFDQIARALLANGHDVHAYMNGKCSKTTSMAALGVTIHEFNHYCMADDPEAMKEHMDMFFNDPGILDIMATFRSMGKKLSAEVETFFSNETAINEMKDVGFDLCIVDGLFQTQFFHIIPYKLDIPTVSFLAVFEPILAGVPGLPSFTPYINFGRYTNEMTFLERVHNTLLTTMYGAAMNFVNPGNSNDLLVRYVPEKPFITVSDLQKKAKLWLVMNDVVIDYPQVRMPHVIDVGGLNTRPGRPLPDDIKKISDEAREGLIVVSFGSYIADFPAKINKKLFKAFGELKQTVIMRFEKKVENMPPNIHLIEWISQNDLLAHPNTVLFITHCGANGQFEALYNGVPMLGLPIFGDQYYNALRMASKGMGLHLDLLTSTAEEVVSAVNEITGNSSFHQAMALRSAAFRDRLETPMERLVHAVEDLLKYGPDILYNEAINLPWYAYWCLDVAVFLTLSVAVMMYLSFVILRCIFRCAFCKKNEKLKKQ